LQSRAGGIKQLLAALLLALTPMLLAYGVFVPVSQSNDDIALEMLASGRGIASAPTPFLLFINVLIGKLLAGLYSQWPAVAWYRLFLLGVHLLAGWTIAWLAFRDGLSWTKLALACNFFLLFDLFFYVRPHFTCTSGVAALAAVALWLGQLVRGQRLRGLRLVWFFVLVGFSGLMRTENCLLMLLVAVPNSLLAGWLAQAQARIRPSDQELSQMAAPVPTQPVWRWLFVAVAMPPALGALLATGLQLYNDRVYATTPGWEDFYEFNRLRAEFTDYRRANYNAVTKTLFDNVGWSANDFALLVRWFFPDDRLYNTTTFQKVLAGFPRAQSVGTRLLIGRIVEDWLRIPNLRALLGGAIIPLLFVRRRRDAGMVVLAQASALIVMLVVLHVRHRLPPWVYGPLLAFPTVVAMTLPGSEQRANRFSSALSALGCASLLVASASALWQYQEETTTALELHTRLKAEIAKLDPHSHQLYVAWGGMFPLELILYASDLQDWRDFKMLGTGFTTHSPVNRTRLREFGIANIYRALCHRKNVFLITHEDSKDGFRRYVQEHFAEDAESTTILATTLGEWSAYNGSMGKMMTYPRGFTVYQLSVPDLKK
jgi:hypothetical protein